MISPAAALFPYDSLSRAFDAAMQQVGSNLSFGSDGVVTCRQPETPRDFRISSFWHASRRVIDSLDALKSQKTSGKRRYPTWVFTMHPNIIWGMKARKALIHLYRFAERERWEAIPGILTGLFSSQTAEAITVGKRLSVDEYADLWLETIGSSIYAIGEHLRPGQLQTWIGVDIDGSDADFVNHKRIKKVCQRFMGWTMDQYQEFIRHYKDENRLLVEEIEDSLEATRAGVYDRALRPNAYRNPEELVADLERLLPSLQSHDRKKVRTFMKKVRTLGFTTLQFQPRINSSSVWVTIQAIAAANGIKGSKTKMVEKLSQVQNPKLDGLEDPIAKWVIDVMAGYCEVLMRTNRLENAVLANCQSVLDIKAARLLFKICGLPKIRVIDLKEDNAGMELANVRKCAAEAEGVSMCGCSDTPRNLGYVGGLIALMQGLDIIGQAGKQPYFGRAYHLCRGGGELSQFLEVMGAPENFFSLFQGDDVFFGCISPEMALETLAPRVGDISRTEVPKVLSKVRKEATAGFRKLVEHPEFNTFWDTISGLCKSLVISARPAARSANGSSGGQGWEASRAIGVVQTAVAVMAYYPHLFGASIALHNNRVALAKLYAEGNAHVLFLINGIKALLEDMDISHFREIAKGTMSEGLIEEVTADFWSLRSVIREIEGTGAFRMHDAPASIERARLTVQKLAKLGTRDSHQEAELAGALHCLLSFARTSG